MLRIFVGITMMGIVVLVIMTFFIHMEKVVFRERAEPIINGLNDFAKKTSAYPYLVEGEKRADTRHVRGSQEWWNEVVISLYNGLDAARGERLDREGIICLTWLDDGSSDGEYLRVIRRAMTLRNHFRDSRM